LPGDPADVRSIQSILVGFTLIRALQADSRPMSLTELAMAAGMPPGRAHAYLTSFRVLGLVQQKAEGERYALGPYALALGISALARLEVREVAEPVMRHFHDITGEGIYMSVWSGQAPVIVSRLDGARSLPLTIRVGFALPLESSATGRVFLAFLPDAMRQLDAAPGRGPSAAAGLERILGEVRARRLARADSLIYTGLNAVSAPVFDHEGRLAATLTALGPAGEMDTNFEGSIALALAAAAATTSRALGHDLATVLAEDRRPAVGEARSRDEKAKHPNR
jgi:DNA-binding IclR family transcriptional regulator